MLREQTKTYIASLTDAELVEYLTVGTRMYEPDALAFADRELTRRNLSEEQIRNLRPPPAASGASNAQRRTAMMFASEAVVCFRCGVEAPTRYVAYRQQIGLVLLRLSKTYRERLCRNCNNRLFWEYTLITLFFGWWGVVSFFVTIVCLVGNIVSFLRTRSLAPVPPGAGRPRLDAAVVATVRAHFGVIAERMSGAVDINDIAREVAQLAGVTPGQAWCVITDLRTPLVAAAQPMGPPSARGFAVIVPGPASDAVEMPEGLEIVSDGADAG